jgi:hypothetical protein
MVNFYTYFITCNSTATIADVIGKLKHVLINNTESVYYICVCVIRIIAVAFGNSSQNITY